MSATNTPDTLAKKFAELEKKFRDLESAAAAKGIVAWKDSGNRTVLYFDPEQEGINLGGEGGIVNAKDPIVTAAQAWVTCWRLTTPFTNCPRVIYSGDIVAPAGTTAFIRLICENTGAVSATTTVDPGTSKKCEIQWAHGNMNQRNGSVAIQVFSQGGGNVQVKGPYLFGMMYPWATELQDQQWRKY